MHRKARQQVDKLIGEKDQLQIDVTRLERELSQQEETFQNIEDRYQYVVDACIEPYARNRGMAFDQHHGRSLELVVNPLSKDALQARSLHNEWRTSRRTIGSLRKDLRSSQNEVQTVRRELNTLQTELLARVEKIEVLADEQLAMEFRTLAADVKALSRAVRCSKDVNVMEQLSCIGLLENVSQHDWMERSRRKYLLEAWTWSVLLLGVFGSPFTTFGDKYTILTKSWVLIFGSEGAHGWPAPDTSCETWRYTTVEQLSKSSNEGMSAVGRKAQDASAKARATIVSVLEACMEAVSPAVPNDQILAIVEKAWGLALRMAQQRARLQITQPLPGAKFNREEMESMPDLEGDELADGFVAFIVSPGLTKWGDASGRNLDQRYDIVPASVQLEAQPRVMRMEQDLKFLNMEDAELGADQVREELGVTQIKESPVIKVGDEETQPIKVEDMEERVLLIETEEAV